LLVWFWFDGVAFKKSAGLRDREVSLTAAFACYATRFEVGNVYAASDAETARATAGMTARHAKAEAKALGKNFGGFLRGLAGDVGRAVQVQNGEDS
jgi:hypothetical protein